jgi:hypothetical protein
MPRDSSIAMPAMNSHFPERDTGLRVAELSPGSTAAADVGHRRAGMGLQLGVTSV